MEYKFKCHKCGKVEDRDIPMKDYSELKDKQFCPKCSSKMSRVLEWEGMAEGSGEGWYGRPYL